MTRKQHRSARRLAGLMLTLLASVAAAMDAPLRAVHEEIAADHPTVVHVDGELLDGLAAAEVVLFDVRDAREYRVSRLPGAMRVDADVDRETFLKRHGAAIDGRAVVFYCSVGRRSSILAERLQESLYDRGATGIANLTGGIFEWRNEERPLVDAEGETRFVHPYDDHWGRYVKDPTAVRYTPR